MKTDKPRRIGIWLYPDDIQRLIEGLKVLCKDLDFYEKRADEKQVFGIAIECFNCKSIQLILESKLEKIYNENN